MQPLDLPGNVCGTQHSQCKRFSGKAGSESAFSDRVYPEFCVNVLRECKQQKLVRGGSGLTDTALYRSLNCIHLLSSFSVRLEKNTVRAFRPLVFSAGKCKERFIKSIWFISMETCFAQTRSAVKHNHHYHQITIFREIGFIQTFEQFFHFIIFQIFFFYSLFR